MRASTSRGAEPRSTTTLSHRSRLPSASSDLVDPTVAVDGHQLGADGGDDAEVDTRGLQRGGSLRRVDAGEHVARAHRVHLGGAGGERDVVRVQVLDAIGACAR